MASGDLREERTNQELRRAAGGLAQPARSWKRAAIAMNWDSTRRKASTTTSLAALSTVGAVPPARSAA